MRKQYIGYRRIDIKLGIYDTEYTAVYHRDGSITVKSPGIKWQNNTGALTFTKIKIEDSKRVKMIKQMFAKNEFCRDSGLVIDDLLF